MFKKLAGSLAAVALLAASPVMAQSYDFSTFATQGQSFQNATLGLMTLSSSNGLLTYTNNYGGGLLDGTDGIAAATSDITLTFAEAVSSVSVRAGDGAGDLDAFGLAVYEFGTNNLLGEFYSPTFGGSNEPEWYTLTVSGLGNIGRIVFDPCNAGNCPGDNLSTGGVVVTDITITAAIPEPSTYALMLAGLAAVGVAARRRSAR